MDCGNFHSYIVPGLDVLIGDPSFLTPTEDTKPKAEMLFIPSFYVYRTMDFYKEQSNRGDSARELTTIFGEIAGRMNYNNSDTFVFKNGMRLKFQDFPEHPVFHGLNGNSSEKYSSSKFHAIATAKALQKQYGKGKVAIMTGSDILATPAIFNQIDVARVNPDVYTGRVRVEFPDECAGHWWANHAIPKAVWDDIFPNHPLVLNQYVEFSFESNGRSSRPFSAIGRFNGEAVVPLKSMYIDHLAFRRIQPKTPGQAMLFDALLTPSSELPIVIVSGIFGTGKTFCTVATGLAQAMQQKYERIFVCPQDSALGREIGFLKGDKLDKVLPQAAPILDNLESVVRLMDRATNPASEQKSREGGTAKQPNEPKPENKEVEPELGVEQRKLLAERYREQYFEFEPLVFMKGRSIERSFIVYDEFQDTERSQARALLSRIGNDSKIVIMGDPNQTTNPHLNRTSNGLSYSASKMAGDPLAAVITFDENSEVVRSDAAKHIAERFSMHGSVRI